MHKISSPPIEQENEACLREGPESPPGIRAWHPPTIHCVSGEGSLERWPDAGRGGQGSPPLSQGLDQHCCIWRCTTHNTVQSTAQCTVHCTSVREWCGREPEVPEVRSGLADCRALGLTRIILEHYF